MSTWYKRGRFLGFEIQHIIPSKVATATSLLGIEAKRFVQSISFDLGSEPKQDIADAVVL